ncbi:SPFH domain-containing protein [Lentisphaera profundi]|uniref:SPFH domain-containing protein n=1 Tax=Lentisphaera profundi TaxID=1658616 RepID=A0ABY7VP57_9BACT|nr:SPFH domain-containing protein [Lentisphaera profundi]WDE95943.1 SPFH domain-containing protein [Lentisphaera profundi]
MTYKRQQKLALFTAIGSFVLLSIFALLISKSPENSYGPVLQAGLALLASALIALLSYFHAGACTRAAIEQQDLEDRPPEDNIFTDSEEKEFIGPQQRNLVSFRKLIIPIFLILISAIEFSGAIYFFNLSVPENLKLPEQGSNPFLLNSFLLFGLAFIFFATGKYLAGVAYGEKASLIRPSSGRLLFLAFASLIAGSASLLANYNHLQWIDHANKALACITLVLACERLLLWILDMYRPRESDEDESPVYESRLLSIFSRPSGFIGNLSDVMEYQFGFRISEEIIKGFLFKILFPFASLQLILLILFSAITYIPPGHTAIISGSGKSEIRQSGLSFSLPYPLSSVQRFETSKIHKLNFTMGPDLRTDREISKREFLADKSWTNEDYQASVFLTGAGKNSNTTGLAVLNAQVHYKIDTDKILDWAQFEEPEKQVKSIARRALTKTLLHNSFSELYQLSRQELEGSIANAIQKTMKENNTSLGIKIINVEVLNFQPHPVIADSWNQKLDAKEKARLILDQAKTYALSSEFSALSEKSAIENTSNSKFLMSQALSEADRDIFEIRLAAFRKYKTLYTQFEYIEVLTEHLSKVRKIVFTKEQKKIATLDLKKPQPNILDITE